MPFTVSFLNNKLSKDVQGLSSLCDQTALQNLQLATIMPMKCINVPAIIKHAVCRCLAAGFLHV